MIQWDKELDLTESIELVIAASEGDDTNRRQGLSLLIEKFGVSLDLIHAIAGHCAQEEREHGEGVV